MTVVLVAHDGAAWLPQALEALEQQTVRPARTVCVDTGSRDGSDALLEAAYGEVVRVPRDTGYGMAVRAALLTVPADTAWVWLLHDDAAPEPTALAALLDHASRTPDAALLGPKVLDWHDPRLLVEVGLTTDAAGHRETGLERREYDQGQHDAPRDVLAVGTAGALVRRDVWDELGGLDRTLPVFRDDLDLGWRVNAAGSRVVVVPAARVRHVRAATTGRRAVDAAEGRPGGVDRRHALFVLLAHATGLRLLLVLPRLVVASLLRAVGYLLTRQVGAARDELAAVVAVLRRPRRLRKARRARDRTRRVPPRALRPLFAPRRARLQAGLSAVGDWVSGGARPGSAAPGTSLDAAAGPGDLDELDAVAGAGGWRRLLLRPAVLLGLGLALVALLAERSLLATGGGVLAGGRLLPAPDGAAQLWSSYAASWHPAGEGSGAPAWPGLAVLAALGTVLLGKAWLAVDLLLLASVPLAGLTAYAATRPLVAAPVLRVWAAATWALLPVATGAVAAGRLDAAAVQVALPLLLLAAHRLRVDDPRTAGWREAWALGLGLSVAAAFAPVLWPLAAVLLLGAAVAGAVRGGGAAARRRVLSALVVAGVPALVLFPWSLHLLSSPGALLHGPGRLTADAALVEPGLAGWQLLLLHPGGAGLPPVWVTAGLLAAAVLGSWRATRRGLANGGWVLALAGLVAALALLRTSVALPGGDGELAVWPGLPLQLAAAGLLAAALAGADGAAQRLARLDFGLRHVVAAVTVVAAAAVPLAAAASWVARGADGPLQRGVEPVLPAFARAELLAEPGLRALVVRPADDGAAYDLVDALGARLGEGDVPTAEGSAARLDALVADLLSLRGSDAAEALSTRAVRYVAVPAEDGDDGAVAAVAAALDAQSGLTRRSAGEVLVWQVTAPAAPLVVLPPETATAATEGARGPDRALLRTAPPAPLAAVAGAELERPTGDGGVALPPGDDGRLLVLAQAADAGWEARLDGRPLERRTAWGWAQAFALPAEGGRLEVGRDGASRTLLLLVQALAVLVVVVLAAPGGRRRRGLEVVDDDADEPAVPAQAGAPRAPAPVAGGPA